MTSRLFDCFTFFDEFDLLEIRLREIDSIVDRFVLVEATRTFQGDEKPLYFRREQHRFRRWAEKIEHVIVDFPRAVPSANSHRQRTLGTPSAAAFDREYYQRDQILRGLANANADDVIMVSDVDEIPKLSVLKRVMETGLYRRNLLLLYMPYYRFFLNCRVVPPERTSGNRIVTPSPGMSMADHEFGSDAAHDQWSGPKLVQRRYLSTPSKLRRVKGDARQFWKNIKLERLGVRLRNRKFCGMANPVVVVRDAGWHFSSLGGYEGWRKKVQSFSHVEYKDSAEFQSQNAFDAWLSRHRIVDLAELPACIGDEQHLWRDLLRNAA